jgi:hypothetical protein
MTRAPWLVAVAGLLAAACATSSRPRVPMSAEDHEEQARLATTARDHAAHQRAATDLRSTEATTCTPSSEPHGGHVPLLLQGTVASVEPEYRGVNHWRRVLRGASLVVTGGDLADLESAKVLIACHLSRAATHGWGGPGEEGCPLCVPGAAATVSAAAHGTRISIRAEAEAGAGEILRRSRALVGRGHTVE